MKQREGQDGVHDGLRVIKADVADERLAKARGSHAFRPKGQRIQAHGLGEIKPEFWYICAILAR